MKKKPLSNFQIVCLLLLWAILTTLVITSSVKLDGPTILSLGIATLLIFIPIYKSISRKNKR